MEKTCTKCGITKKLEDFYKSPDKIFKRENECKECKKRYQAKRHLITYDPIKQRQISIIKIKSGKAEESRKRLAKKYPEKFKARRRFIYAVKTGKIIRQSCERCGEKNAQGHHPDYSKPLEVMWLCRKHHMELHRKYK